MITTYKRHVSFLDVIRIKYLALEDTHPVPFYRHGVGNRRQLLHAGQSDDDDEQQRTKD